MSNILEIRNVALTNQTASYDLFFKYDSSYLIQGGKSLGFRVHEYGNLYSFNVDSLIANAQLRTAGYGNGGSSWATFINSLDYSKSEIAIAHVSWTPDSNSVTQSRNNWSSVLKEFGSDEYSSVALGFSQVDSYSARDVKLSSQEVAAYTGSSTVNGVQDTASNISNSNIVNNSTQHLDIRNVAITSHGVTYDLFFTYDPTYSIQSGKSLGFRIHEYGSLYNFNAESLVTNAQLRTAGYGNGGSSWTVFIDKLDYSKSEMPVAHVSWTPDPNSVLQTKDDWSSLLKEFGSDE
jgi:hypothetical protein